MRRIAAVPDMAVAGCLLAIAAGCAVPVATAHESGGTISAMEPAGCPAQPSEDSSGSALSF